MGDIILTIIAYAIAFGMIGGIIYGFITFVKGLENHLLFVILSSTSGDSNSVRPNK